MIINNTAAAAAHALFIRLFPLIYRKLNAKTRPVNTVVHVGTANTVTPCETPARGRGLDRNEKKYFFSLNENVVTVPLSLVRVYVYPLQRPLFRRFHDLLLSTGIRETLSLCRCNNTRRYAERARNKNIAS